MKYQIIFTSLLLTLVFPACNKSQPKNFTINGDVKGFTKGTVYLQKVVDTLITVIDSTDVYKNGKFSIGDSIDSPEIYYLQIKEKPDESLLIFGEQGIVTVSSKIDKFSTAAVVKGSENHDLLTQYKEMIQKFNGKRLDLFKANFDAERAQDQATLDSLDKAYKNLIRKRYLYTANFAVKHSDKEVAPYIALTELYNANISLLDTVNNALTDRIKVSKYGRKLDRFIRVIKKNETTDSLDSIQNLVP